MKRSSLLIVLSLTFLEWLDFTLYLYLAKTVFAKEFFPPSAYSLSLTFGIFAAAYFARPLGGWFLGRQADRTGRRKPMMFSAALMGFATVGICLLPSYAQIGSGASIGLLVLRIAQGLALGGEINTSGMFLVEHYPNKPLVAGSLVAISGALGMFMGGVLAALNQSFFVSFSWRLLFAIVGGLSLWVCALRKKLIESPEFLRAKTLPVSSRFTDWKGLINIALIAMFASVMVYLGNILWVSYAIDTQLWSPKICAWVGALAQLLSALLALPIARFAKPKDSLRLIQLSMICLFIAAPCLFYYTAHHVRSGVLTAIVGYALGNGLLCSSLFYFLYGQLPTLYRCQGVSTVWALAASIGAISLPIAQQALAYSTGYWVPGLIISGVALLSFLGLSCDIKARPSHGNPNRAVYS